MQKKRKLLSGRLVPEIPIMRTVIESKCPMKWVSFDLENGNVWVLDERYRSPNKKEIEEVKKILERIQKK